MSAIFLICDYFHRAAAAFLAMALRLALLSAWARAAPPLRPSSTAALLRPSSVSSSISPVAIFVTWTALEITSAGRLWPFGVLGILTAKHSTRIAEGGEGDKAEGGEESHGGEQDLFKSDDNWSDLGGGLPGRLHCL